MKHFLQKLELCTEDGVHRVDLQRQKKVENFKNFSKFNKSFFSPHNGNTGHLNSIWRYFNPMYVEKIRNQNLEYSSFFLLFGPITEYNFIISETTTHSYI